MTVYRVKKNHLQHKIGAMWAQEFFLGKNNGFILDARSHDDERKHPHSGPRTEVAYKPDDIRGFIRELNAKAAHDGNLIIVRTFREKGHFVPLYCFIVVVSKHILEKYKNENLYFRFEGKNGKDDWATKGKGLVRYFPIPTNYLGEIFD